MSKPLNYPEGSGGGTLGMKTEDVFRKSAHTPGPWRVEQETKAVSRIVGAYGDEVVENCWTVDAHLIAAAPEMLEVLRELLSDTKSTEDARTDAGFYGAKHARALLARVEGAK